jgi:hypothetical protein
MGGVSERSEQLTPADELSSLSPLFDDPEPRAEAVEVGAPVITAPVAIDPRSTAAARMEILEEEEEVDTSPREHIGRFIADRRDREISDEVLIHFRMPDDPVQRAAGVISSSIICTPEAICRMLRSTTGRNKPGFYREARPYTRIAAGTARAAIEPSTFPTGDESIIRLGGEEDKGDEEDPGGDDKRGEDGAGKEVDITEDRSDGTLDDSLITRLSSLDFGDPEETTSKMELG